MVNDGDGGPGQDPWGSDVRQTLATLGEQVGVWRWDFSDGSVFWSKRLLEMYGLEEDDFEPVADSFFDRVHPDDIGMVQARIAAHLERDEPYRCILRVRHRDGHYVECRTEGAAMRGPDGVALTMAGVTFDISQEMQAVRELHESEQRLATLAANFEGAIFRYRLNTDGTDSIDYMSAGAEKVWGLKAEEIVGDPGKVWATVHPDDVAGVESAFGRGTQSQTKLQHRWRVVLPDGYNRWIECRATPTRSPDGDTLWDGFVIDISESMAAREELRQKTEMLGQSQKLEAVGRIAGGIAHDFNNLLAVILGNAELFEPEGLNDEDREARQSIIAASQKGADLTRRLLSFARQSQLDPKCVALKTVVGQMLPLLRRTLPEDIAIDWQNKDSPEAEISVDVGLLESSILNIMVNARDAMPEGGSLSIRIREHRFAEDQLTGRGDVVPAGDFVALEIADTGNGIAADLLPRVTEPFVTSKGPEMGSGLGLAMVDGFVDQSGGLLRIQSREGEGTAVTLYIPAATGEATADVGVRATGGSGERLSGRALLVEDETAVRLVLSRVLRQMGLQVDAATNGQEAIAYLDRDGHRVDLLITDVVMPGQPKGPELARRFRERLPGLPVILLSGYSDEQLHGTGKLTGGDVFLTKPVSRQALAEAVTQVMAAKPIEAGSGQE